MSGLCEYDQSSLEVCMKTEQWDLLKSFLQRGYKEE
jgi:hypothetical protein